MYVVILAGGGGTRLWPLSTPDRPKPFLPLLADGESLFQRTIGRLRAPGLGDFDVGHDLYVIVDGRFAQLARDQARAEAPGLDEAHVVAEPKGRNTAAAIALATAAIKRDDDEVMVVLPADHLIPGDKEGVFGAVLDAADRGLAQDFPGIPDALVTLGVQPDRPATEYGYLQPDVKRRVQRGGLDAYPLRAFIEKPDGARAERLIKQAGVAWNAGMFLWRRRAIRAALRAYPKAAPIWAAVEAGRRTGDLAGAYDRLEPFATSIDYAVMEPAAAAGQVVMGSMDVGWSDLGSWHALLGALGAPDIDGRVVKPGEVVELGGGDLLVEREGWPADGAFHLAVGPATMGPFDRPTALLRDAARHERVVTDLLARARSQGGPPA
ncbi:MAG TPA: sugar phosphate nucleotidyltransferase [Candidatus Baltobacteraceae bacterium]|nr:sugar phosphate nucleotidyltransferase [Candidatus Baltobacteraceae bacterium]